MLITQFLTDLNRDALIDLFCLAAVKNVEAAHPKSGTPYVQCLVRKGRKSAKPKARINDSPSINNPTQISLLCQIGRIGLTEYRQANKTNPNRSTVFSLVTTASKGI